MVSPAGSCWPDVGANALFEGTACNVVWAWGGGGRHEVKTIAHAAELGARLAADFPQLDDGAAGFAGALMRINRDTRFSADKPPYKTRVAMMFVPAGGSKMGSPAGLGCRSPPTTSSW